MTPPESSLSRPAQDALWLERLQREGVEALLPRPPSPPESFAASLQQLTQGLYWEAHESLEDVWRDTPYPLKLFYYGLIKLAVGLLHLERGNLRSATNQLGPAVQYLSPFAPIFFGVRTDAILEQAKERLEALAVMNRGTNAKGAERLPLFQFPAQQ